MKNKDEIELFLLINEPAFEIGDVQYSVCCPHGKLFCTWDSDGNTFDFQGIDDLLEHWIVGGKPFKEIVNTIM